MTARPISLGPWPEGQDTYHQGTHALFQVGGERLARLTAAVNVDIDDAGWVSARAGLTNRVTLTAGKNVFRYKNRLLVQDGGALKLINPSDWSESTLISGLNASETIRFCEQYGRVWYTNSEVCGQVYTDYSHRTWGAAACPAPSLTASTGNLPAGRYLVACTFVDTNNVEHGSVEHEVITLSGTGGIEVDIDPVASEAVSVNVYVSSTNQADLFWSQNVLVANLPVTISDLSSDVRNSTRPLRTLNMRAPVPGNGIAAHMGFLFIWRDNVLFRNNGMNPHVFYVEQHVRAYPHNIKSVVGLEGGFWVVTEYGAWFVTGDQPENWRSIQRDSRMYAAGGIRASGRLFPRLETSALVALFVSEDGLMVGLPSGQMIAVTDEQFPLDVEDKEAFICVRTISGIRQVLMTLV